MIATILLILSATFGNLTGTYTVAMDALAGSLSTDTHARRGDMRPAVRVCSYTPLVTSMAVPNTYARVQSAFVSGLFEQCTGLAWIGEGYTRRGKAELARALDSYRQADNALCAVVSLNGQEC